MSDLETLIKSALPHTSQSAGGWNQLKCPVCNDYKIRAGFKFEGDKISYNCFRGKCEIGKISYTMGEYIPQKFRTLMKALNVQIPPELFLNANKKTITETLNADLYEQHWYKEVELLPSFHKYNPERDVPYRRYLEDRRMFDDDYYIGTRGEWKNKLIIPFRHNGKLIGWQGVDIVTGYYLKSSDNSDLIYLPKGVIPSEPLVVEGVFDAKSIPNGIAILQSTISKKQAFLLKDKKPVLLPDRKGSRFLTDIKQYGWTMCVPTWNHKDANAAVKDYGRLIVAKMIHDGMTKNHTEAEVKFKMWEI